MASSKRFVILAVVSSALLLLLLLVGGLAWAFFDMLAARAKTSLPYYAVSTSAVERVRQPPAGSHDDIVLQMPSPAPFATPTPNPQDFLADLPPPAACVNYPPSITSRQAWQNPVEIQTTVITPARIKVAMYPPNPKQEAAP